MLAGLAPQHQCVPCPTPFCVHRAVRLQRQVYIAAFGSEVFFWLLLNSKRVAISSPLVANVLWQCWDELWCSQVCTQCGIHLGIQHIIGGGPANSDCSALHPGSPGLQVECQHHPRPGMRFRVTESTLAVSERMTVRSIARGVACKAACYIIVHSGARAVYLQRDGCAHVGCFPSILALLILAVEGEALAEGALNGPSFHPCIRSVQRRIRALHVP